MLTITEYYREAKSSRRQVLNWIDSNGRQRNGAEPPARTAIRYYVQAASTPEEYREAREQLQRFDREWP